MADAVLSFSKFSAGSLRAVQLLMRQNNITIKD